MARSTRPEPAILRADNEELPVIAGDESSAPSVWWWHRLVPVSMSMAVTLAVAEGGIHCPSAKAGVAGRVGARQ